MNHSRAGFRTVTRELADDDATMALGECLSRLAGPGVTIALNGNLGAGKTTLTRGFARALGVDESTVSSPTYVLHQIYPTNQGWLIHHFDVYRLEDSGQFEDLGVGEIFDSGGVCLVEWADKAADSLPPDAWKIDLEHVAGGLARRALITVPEEIARRLEAAKSSDSGRSDDHVPASE